MIILSVSHFTLIPLDNYKTQEPPRLANAGVLLYGLIPSLLQPAVQVKHHLCPVGFIQDFMPVTRIQFHLHVLHPGICIFFVHLPDSFSKISHRILFSGNEKYRKCLWNFFHASFSCQGLHSGKHMIIAVDCKSKAAQRITLVGFPKLRIRCYPLFLALPSQTSY